MTVTHMVLEALEAGLDAICQSPKDRGVLDLIVRRPRVDAREVLEHGELHVVKGLVGDRWSDRLSSWIPGHLPPPDTQLNVMNSRVIALIAQDKSRWPLAGDQLFVDLDLAAANVPVGTRLALGEAVIEVTPEPHTGCHKFVARFGVDAMKFVNSPVGRRLQLRGINAKVVLPGRIQVGDAVNKLR